MTCAPHRSGTSSTSKQGKCSLQQLGLLQVDGSIEEIAPCIPFVKLLFLVMFGNCNDCKGWTLISQSILTAVSKNENSLEELNLFWNYNDEAIRKLVPCFPYLQILCVVENEVITAAGFKIVSDTIHSAALKDENNLKILWLDGDYNDESIIQLAPCAIYLEELIIKNNKLITRTGFRVLSDAIHSAVLQNVNCLRILDLTGIEIEKTLISELKQRASYLEIKI